MAAVEYEYRIEAINGSGSWMPTSAIHKPTQISKQGALGVLHNCRTGNPSKQYRLVKLTKEIVD
jgi:hypothetical protein